MPHTLDVRCPSCGGRAFFEFAEAVRIRERKDIAFFQESNQFDYLRCKDSCGHYWHAAIYYAGLHGRTVESIRELPDGYAKSEFAHSRYLYRSAGPRLGSISCDRCHLYQRHKLDWPKDAYFQIEYKDDVLWAFNAESAVELFHYITSTNRTRDHYKWEAFLMKVPTKFLRRGARKTITKRLEKLIRPNTTAPLHL